MFASQIEIHKERILTKFADLAFANRYRLYRIFLVTPWIGFKETSRDPLIRVIAAAQQKNPDVVLITRKPDNEWHQKAIRFLRSKCSITSHVLQDLHAKLYVLQCDGFTSAFLGSPNFSSQANITNQEIAVQFCTTKTDPEDRVVALIEDLLVYVDQLRSMAELLRD